MHSVGGFLVDLHHSVPVLDQGRNISAAQWMGEICKSLVLDCPYKQEDFQYKDSKSLYPFVLSVSVSEVQPTLHRA